MGLFDFFRKKKNKEVEPQAIATENSILLAMPIFINDGGYDLDKLIVHLQTFWNMEVSEISGDNSTAVFDLDGQPVALGNMPASIPQEELDDIINYAYLWKDAREVLKEHTSHAIVSVLRSDKPQVERYKLLSKLICSIMLTSPDCIGIYQGQETLLLQRDFYLSAVEDLQNDRIPVPAWIYIGLVNGDTGINAYTYGMKSFGKPEFEVINTPLDSNQLYTLILNIVSYTLGKDVTFNNGDTFSISENAMMKITTSKGTYVEGTTLKLEIA